MIAFYSIVILKVFLCFFNIFVPAISVLIATFLSDFHLSIFSVLLVSSSNYVKTYSFGSLEDKIRSEDIRREVDISSLEEKKGNQT